MTSLRMIIFMSLVFSFIFNVYLYAVTDEQQPKRESPYAAFIR